MFSGGYMRKLFRILSLNTLKATTVAILSFMMAVSSVGAVTFDTGSSETSNPATIIVDGDITLTATTQLKEPTITFNANGGTVSPTTKKVVATETYGTLPEPTRKGYVFDG